MVNLNTTDSELSVSYSFLLATTAVCGIVALYSLGSRACRLLSPARSRDVNPIPNKDTLKKLESMPLQIQQNNSKQQESSNTVAVSKEAGHKASLQNTSAWQTVKQSLTSETVKIENTEYQAYSPKIQKFTFAITAFSVLIKSLYDDWELTVKRRMQREPSVINATLAFPIDKTNQRITETIDEIAQNLLSPKIDDTKSKEADKKGSTETQSQQATRLFGVTFQQQNELLAKVKKNAIDYFKGKAQLLSGREVFYIDADSFKAVEWPLKKDLMIYMYKKWGLLRSKDPVTYKQSQLKEFGILSEKKLPDPQKLSCFQFALLQLKEKNAKNYIFKSEKLPNILTSLKSWGYTPVAEPSQDDLAIYLDTNGVPQHMGRFLPNGKIESKLGILTEYLHHHDLFDVSPIHGRRVVFMRKTGIKNL